MPEPKANETEQDFVKRCVPIVMGEGDTQEQALGKCYGIYRSKKKKSMVEMIGKAIESLKVMIKQQELKETVDKYGPEILEKAMTVDGFESPEPGDIPEAGKKLLAEVYAKCRTDGGDKEKCAKIAWHAVDNAGLNKSETTEVLKSLKKLLEMITKG